MSNRAPARDLYIDGAWTAPADGRTFSVLNPYTREAFADVAAGTRPDAERAIDAAAAAFEEWAALAPAGKQRLFQRAAALVEARRDRAVDELIDEAGCTATFANALQDTVVANLHHAASWVYAPRGEVLQSNYPDTTSL